MFLRKTVLFATVFFSTQTHGMFFVARTIASKVATKAGQTITQRAVPFAEKMITIAKQNPKQALYVLTGAAIGEQTSDTGLINTVTGTVLGGYAGAYFAGAHLANAARIAYLENLVSVTATENIMLRTALQNIKTESARIAAKAPEALSVIQKSLSAAQELIKKNTAHLFSYRSLFSSAHFFAIM